MVSRSNVPPQKGYFPEDSDEEDEKNNQTTQSQVLITNDNQVNDLEGASQSEFNSGGRLLESPTMDTLNMASQSNNSNDFYRYQQQNRQVPQEAHGVMNFGTMNSSVGQSHQQQIGFNKPPTVARIPWRTIGVAFLFFIVGSVFLLWGTYDFLAFGYHFAYEKWIIGMLLFIPGAYHTFLAIQALRGIEGWNYDNLTTFESEQYHFNPR